MTSGGRLAAGSVTAAEAAVGPGGRKRIMPKAVVPAFTVLLICGVGLLVHKTLSAGGGGSAPGRTVTVTDLAGRRVTFKQPIERIVLVRGRDIHVLAAVLGDEIDEKLIAWGSDVQSYDRDTYRKFLASHPRLAELPALGSVYEDGVSPERVLSLKPDLVIVDTFMTDRGYRCVDQMEQAGLPLLFLNFARDPFKDPQRSIALLGRVLGKERRAEEIVDVIDAEIDKVLSRLDNIKGPVPSVYIECGHLGVNQYGPTYGYNEGQRTVSWGTVLHRLRCRNIAAGVVPSMGAISPEYLLKADPDVIVVTGACWPALPDTMRLGYYTDTADARRRLKAFTTRPGWADLKAVKSGRVYSVYHVACLQTTGYAVLQQLAKWLYPGQFDDLDPEASLKAFHEKFMPLDYSGVWTVALDEKQ